MSKYSFRLKIILTSMVTAILPFVLSCFLIFVSKKEIIISEFSNMNGFLVLMIISSMVFALLLSIFLSYSIIKPLNKITKVAEIISEGNLDYDIPVESDDEIGFLGECMKKMLVGLKATYLVLKKRTKELTESNEQLQDMNMELEASLEQLKATTMQLNESEEKFRNLVENMMDMVWVVDNEGNIVYVNNKSKQLLGYEELELIGRYMIDILPHDSLDIIFELIKDSETDRIEMEFLSKDGVEIITDTSIKRIEEDGRIIGVQGVSRDITDRKIMEAELNRKLAELQAINKVSKDIATTTDLKNVLDQIVTQVVNVSDAIACTIRLISRIDPNKLVLKAAQGLKIDEVTRGDIDKRYDIMGKAVESKLPFMVKLKDSVISNQYVKMLFKNGYAKYMLFNPLIVRDRVIGILTSFTEEPPTQSHIDLITSLANNLAIAIDNAEAYHRLKQSFFQTVQSLVSAVEAKDLYTESHSLRVSQYAVFIAEEMGYDENFREKIRVTGLLHDIGKIGIGDLILNKKGKLTSEEYGIIKRHPDIACRILKGIELDGDIINGIRYHHERYDGKGYPNHFGGEDIPIIASIISVADAFDAMTSERSYKEAISFGKAAEELLKNRGTQFNPEVVDSFMTIYRERKNDIMNVNKHNGENPWEYING